MKYYITLKHTNTLKNKFETRYSAKRRIFVQYSLKGIKAIYLCKQFTPQVLDYVRMQAAIPESTRKGLTSWPGPVLGQGEL